MSELLPGRDWRRWWVWLGCAQLRAGRSRVCRRWFHWDRRRCGRLWRCPAGCFATRNDSDLQWKEPHIADRLPLTRAFVDASTVSFERNADIESSLTFDSFLRCRSPMVFYYCFPFEIKVSYIPAVRTETKQVLPFTFDWRWESWVFSGFHGLVIIRMKGELQARPESKRVKQDPRPISRYANTELALETFKKGKAEQQRRDYLKAI